MKNIYLANPSITDHEIKDVVKVLKSGMLVQGKIVSEIEGIISKLTGSLYPSMVSNGTATMHIALKILGVGKGDEVIVPAFSYVATANVVELVGAKPIFVDVELDSFNINTDLIRAAITPKTKAIIPVHEFGLAANMTEVMKIAEEFNLFVVEDAACAIGASWKNKHVGTYGDFGSFSFHPRKSITSGEGGCIICNSKENDRMVKILRNHGIELSNGQMDFVEAGFNYRLTDFQAALLKGQFERLAETLVAKKALAEVYFKKIKTDKITLPSIPKGATHSWQSFHIITKTKEDRDGLKQYLADNKVFANYGAQCIPDCTYYLNKYNLDSKTSFSNAYKAYTCGLVLPLYEKLEESDIVRVSNLINNYYKHDT
tara:strand:- start:174 stop:1289 length:1116 start_codon:yes stop_codon:yes gene_type:complete